MKYKGIKIKKYDWEVDFFFDVDKNDYYDIEDSMYWMMASNSQLKDLQETLERDEPNSGITYSNLKTRRTVVIIGKSISNAEFNDTIVHEIQHIIQSISKVYGIDPYGEEIAYLSGDIVKLISPEV